MPCASRRRGDCSGAAWTSLRALAGRALRAGAARFSRRPARTRSGAGRDSPGPPLGWACVNDTGGVTGPSGRGAGRVGKRPARPGPPEPGTPTSLAPRAAREPNTELEIEPELWPEIEPEPEPEIEPEPESEIEPEPEPEPEIEPDAALARLLMLATLRAGRGPEAARCPCPWEYAWESAKLSARLWGPGSSRGSSEMAGALFIGRFLPTCRMKPYCSALVCQISYLKVALARKLPGSPRHLATSSDI